MINAKDVFDPPGKNRKGTRDLHFRMAYTKSELTRILPYGQTTLDEMIRKGLFPDGMRPHPTGHKIWPKSLIEEWLKSDR
jgi:predicted DNA-binding transcriptional regulator AlpA